MCKFPASKQVGAAGRIFFRKKIGEAGRFRRGNQFGATGRLQRIRQSIRRPVAIASMMPSAIMRMAQSERFSVWIAVAVFAGADGFFVSEHPGRRLVAFEVPYSLSARARLHIGSHMWIPAIRRHANPYGYEEIRAR